MLLVDNAAILGGHAAILVGTRRKQLWRHSESNSPVGKEANFSSTFSTAAPSAFVSYLSFCPRLLR
jgi:hypothetical protein